MVLNLPAGANQPRHLVLQQVATGLWGMILECFDQHGVWQVASESVNILVRPVEHHGAVERVRLWERGYLSHSRGIAPQSSFRSASKGSKF